MKGNKDTVELLMAKGGDINARYDIGYTPLDEANRSGHKDVAELLEKHGARE